MDGKTIVAKGGEQNELISVIIPTYNRVGLLGRSIQSVLSQTYTNLELIIIDDCSNDNTGEFVKGLSDERICYHRNEHNMGLAGAKNVGASLAKGELLAFQDDDDEWLPDKLMRLMEVWKKESDEETGMIYHEMQEQGASTFIPSRDIPLEWKSKEIFQHMLLYPMIGATASLIRKSCLDELGGFNEKLGSIEDYEFYLRMAKKYKILFVGEPLMIIYDTPGSVNKRFKSKIDTELHVLNTMYDSLCQYDILQKKVNLIRQQAENYDCEDYFYEQALQLCEGLEEKEEGGDKQKRIKACIRNAAKEISQSGGGDRAEYYQNAAGQIQRVILGLTKLQENLKKNPAVLSQNRPAVVEALLDIIKNLADYEDLALHPVPYRQRMDELLEKLTEGQKSNGIIKDALSNTLKEALQLFSQIGKAKCRCTVCGKEVRFLPPSPYKRVMREHYGYKGEGIDFLFEGEEDRCPVCGASENIRFLLGFLEDVQPEGDEKLKICCMEAKSAANELLPEWIRKYAHIKKYMEYVPFKDAEGKMDIIICADILEQTADVSGVLEEIYRMLKDDGVCVVMVSALCTGEDGGKMSKSVEAPAEEDSKESWEKFGLEGINCIYTKEELALKFEEKGFNVNVANVGWFGTEYYGQCGFGEHAQLFMLTKR
ncbi:MAG: glycosyltransferase [Lachnospiraceae bacterium]|nr:glycosyltransferase [Lachnospiraceae bacterium]